MKSRVLFVTGTNTSVGKTVVSSLLTRYLLEGGLQIRAVKPLCAGGRDDAVALSAAQGGRLTLDEVNPWSFASSITPLLAARRRHRSISKVEVLQFLRKAQKKCDVLLVEGAGGLLSPLGEGFSSRELILALNATPIVVCPNRLGAINLSRLVLEALPPAARKRAQVVLVARPHADPSSRSNAAMIREFTPSQAVHEIPWLGSIVNTASVKFEGRLKRALQHLADAL
ncbi:MAG: dethiobiotin synthase [Verrucomicrobia bacterium]|jgi:dethiobiotin synthetase|nr:dethiobiotin synthase [Verrucomicrobiota bacterium]